MGSEKLFLEDIEAGYLTNFTAQVTIAEEDKVVLDRTLFYPLGGGQNWDTGTLDGPNGILQVSEVRGRDDIYHHLEKGHQLEVGDEITGKIDWHRRYEHMRMHTAQHLVSGVVYDNFNAARTVGNQIHTERSRIDFNPIKFDEEMLQQLTQLTNDLIDENHTVSDEEMTRSEINALMPPERTNMDLLPASINNLRVVKIGDSLDLCPCAGTHVKQLGEIGHIEIIGKKSKGKGTQRISYTLHKGEISFEPNNNII
ncbi:MAG: alanyl-tRNA editing protein [Euryarchaeota archaeon]|nr:alanyl-tRNA editing protein [Euryarchaeota archaeon]